MDLHLIARFLCAVILTFPVRVWVRVSPEPHPYVDVQHIDEKYAHKILIRKRQHLDLTKLTRKDLRYQLGQVDNVDIRFVIRWSVVLNPLYGAVAAGRWGERTIEGVQEKACER